MKLCSMHMLRFAIDSRYYMSLVKTFLFDIRKKQTKFERLYLIYICLFILVEIGRRQVTVYPNEKDRPGEGEELNCQAIISLLGVYPIDRSVSNSNEEITDPDRLMDMNYGKYLEGITKKFDGEFIGYDVYTGTWSFQVEHF